MLESEATADAEEDFVPSSSVYGGTRADPGSVESDSLIRGPPVSRRSTSKRCSFWYRCLISPAGVIQTRVFRIRLEGGDVGSWMPTLMCSCDCRAESCRPRTNGDVVTG